MKRLKYTRGLKFKKDEVYAVTRTLSSHASGKVLIVGDDGVYFMSGGKVDPNDNPIAYAEGCNPKVDEFDDWWALKGATWGGDDGVEYLDRKEIQSIVEKCKRYLIVSFEGNTFTIKAD